MSSARQVSVVLSADVKPFESAMERASKSAGGVKTFSERAVDKIKSGFSTAGKVAGTVFDLALAGGGKMLTSLTKTGVSYNSLQQNARAALKVIMKDGEAAAKQMDKLDDFASNSPFSKQLWIDAQQELMGFGMAAENVVPTLDAIQNAVAASGKGEEEIRRATSAFAEMESVGGLTGKTIRELQLLGIDAAGILADEFGMTSGEIKKMASKPGGIPVDEVWTPLTNGLMDKFGGATDAIKQQWTGATDRLKAAWRDIGSVLMEPFVAREGGGYAVVWANDVADAMRAAEAKTRDFVGAILQRATPALDGVTTKLQSVTQWIKKITFADINRGLDVMSKYAAPLAGVSGALMAMGTQWGPIAKLGLSLNPVGAAIVAIVLASKDMRDALKPALETLWDARGKVGQLVTTLGDFANSILKAAAPAVGALAEAGADLIVMGIDMLNAGAPLLNTVLTPMIGVVGTLVGVITKLPAPILATVAAFGTLKLLGKTESVKKLAKAYEGLKGKIVGTEDKVKTSSKSIEKVGTSAQTTKGKVSAIGTAFKTAFISNLPLLAISGVIALFGHIASKAADAKAGAESYMDAMKQVGEASEAAARKVAAYNLVMEEHVDWGWWQRATGKYHNLADAIEGAGFSIEEFAAAATGSDADYEAMINRINEMTDGFHFSHFEASHLKSALKDQRTQMKLAQIMAEQLGDTQEELGDSMKDTARATEEAQRALERKASAERASLDAAYAVIDAEKQLAEAMEEGGRLTRDSSGAIDLYSDHSRQVIDPLMSLVDGLNRQAQALVDQGASQEEVNKFMEESREQFAQAAIQAGAYEEEIDGLATSLGYVDTYSSLVIDMTVDTESAHLSLDTLVGEIQEAQNNGGLITIDADSDPALDELFDLMGVVRNEEGQVVIDANTDPSMAKLLLSMGIIDTSTGEVTIDGKNEKVKDKAAKAVEGINNTTAYMTVDGKNEKAKDKAILAKNFAALQTGVLTITGNPAKAKDKAREAKKFAEGQQPRMVFYARIGEVKDKAREADWFVRGRKPRIDIGALIGGAKNKAREADKFARDRRPKMPIGTTDWATSEAWDIARGISRNVTARINVKMPSVSSIPWATSYGQADGGLVNFLADGAFWKDEEHIAQIVPAGSWRVFGEPETGGEAYIPLALSKRKRSEEILEAVARHFDKEVVEVAPYANGGYIPGTPVPAPGGGSSVVINDNSTTINPVALPKDIERREKLARAGSGLGGLV